MGKKSTAAAPDPYATADAQSKQNVATTQANAQLNAVGQYGPWGQTTYEFGNQGGFENVPVAQHTTLTPKGQAVFDNQQNVALDLSNRATTALNNAPQTSFSLDGLKYDPNSYDTNGLPQYHATSYGRGQQVPSTGAAGGNITGGSGTNSVAGSAGSDGLWNLPGTGTPQGSVLPYDPRSYDVEAIDRGAQATSFNESMRNLQPQFDLQTMRNDDNLTNRGIPVGSRAWSQATGDMQRAQNNAIVGASNQAYAQGHQFAGDTINREQGLRTTAYNEGMASHQQAMSDYTTRLQTEQNLRSQALKEREMVRNSAINDASMYLQGAPAMQMPTAGAVPTYQMQAPNVGDMVYNSAQINAAAQQSKNSSNAQALGNAAQAGASMWMMSTAVAKEDIGDASMFLPRVRALKVRSWRYTPEVAAASGTDTELHVGPLAEDWAAQFGGPRTRIHMGDAVFALYAAVQELAHKVDRLEAASV